MQWLAVVTSACICLPSAAQVRASGEPVPLTAGLGQAMNPQWAPDGETIAFSGPAYAGIHLLHVPSGMVRTVTGEAGAGFGYSWSPDGQRIVARVSRVDGARRSSAVKIFEIETGRDWVLTEYRSTMPALPRWDAGGDYVFLYAGRDLEVFDVPGMSGAGQRPDRVEFVIGSPGLGRADLGTRQVQAIEIPGHGQVLNLARSPSGSRVAFEILGGHLYVMGADGADLVDLGRGNRPAWSPNGAWLIFVRADDDGHRITSSDLWTVRPDGSALTQLTHTPDRLETNPSWSPDGRWVAYNDLADGVVYTLRVIE